MDGRATMACRSFTNAAKADFVATSSISATMYNPNRPNNSVAPLAPQDRNTAAKSTMKSANMR